MKFHQRVIALYLFVGAVWIICSNQLAGDGNLLGIVLRASKDWVILMGSAAVLVALARPAKPAERLPDAERKAIYNETVQGVYHVVFNYMNNMQMVLMEAERCDDFNRETLELARTSASGATADLRKLQSLKEITPEHIHAVLYGKMDVSKAQRTDATASGADRAAYVAPEVHSRPVELVA